ncbi:MAG: hypothetical protein AAGF12_40950, partial [Myxococcota bacterium]
MRFCWAAILLTACQSTTPIPPSLEGFDSEAPRFATVGLRWEAAFRARLEEATPPTFSVVEGPEGLTVVGATAEFTPVEGQEGVHPVRLRAAAGNTVMEQSFDLTVLGRTSLGSVTVGAGETTVVLEPSSGPRRVEFDVPPADEASRIELFAVEGDGAPTPVELSAVGKPFYIVSDLPEGTPITVRLAIADVPEMPTDARADEVFATAYGPERGIHDGRRLGDEWRPVPTDRPREGVIEWIENAMGERRAERQYQLTLGDNVTEIQGGFEVVYLLGEGEDRREASRRVDELLGHLLAARTRQQALGCRFPTEQHVTVRNLLLFGSFDPDTLGIEFNKRLFDRSVELHRRAIAAHELFHSSQYLAVGPAMVPIAQRWWVEATAQYMEDETFDENAFLEDPVFFVPTLWPEETTRYGLLYDGNPEHWYRSNAYFKSLKAQEGFNACTFSRLVALSETGLDALTVLVGGPDRFLASYARYVSAYN